MRKGELDAAFFVAAFEADYIQGLLNDRRVNLLSFDQHEAYHRRFRFLAPVTVPAGMVNLAENIPGQDVALLAPTAMLVVRKDFHPALVPLLLATATRIHGKGDELSDPGEFPSESYCDFPVSEDAKRFYKSGQPVLQRLLPFWLASLVDRAKVMLIPLVMLMMPLLRAAPPLMRWRTRRKIYLWYSDLREIDQRLVDGLSGPELDQELARLKDIEHQVAYVDVPLSYMEEFYHLRLHLGMLQQHLIELRARSEPTVGRRSPDALHRLATAGCPGRALGVPSGPWPCAAVRDGRSPPSSAARGLTGINPDSQCMMLSASWRLSVPGSFIPTGRPAAMNCAERTPASPRTTTRPFPWMNASPGNDRRPGTIAYPPDRSIAVRRARKGTLPAARATGRSR